MKQKHGNGTKKFTKAQKELEKPIVEEISTKREPMEKCACNRKEIQQQATTQNKQCKEEKQVEELLHEIGNEKKRSKWKSCYMKQAMKRREASGRVVT